MTGKELEEWREAMGLMKGEAATALDVTPNAYRALERGEAKISLRTEMTCIGLWHRLNVGMRPWHH